MSNPLMYHRVVFLIYQIRKMQDVISRGHDVWANIETGHLSPEKRVTANASKTEIIKYQQGRIMLQSPYDTGKISAKSKVVDTYDSFKKLCQDGLDVLKKGPTVIVLETRGRSNLWAQARKQLDGDSYQKNDESSGVTVIFLNIMDRQNDDIIAFVNIRKIVDEELNGEPRTPPEFKELICHEKGILIADNLLKHLKRIENSFFNRLNGPLYVTLHDLVERWRRHKWEINDHIWDIVLNSGENNGLLFNFHEVFAEETYPKNPYEALSDWDNLKIPRQAQIVYGLNKVHFTMLLIQRVLRYFVHSGLSLSIMGTVFPKYAFGERVDFRNQDACEQGTLPPKWFEEIKWPSCVEERYGECSRVEGIGDPDAVRLEQQKWEKECMEGARGLGEKRKLVVSDVSDDEDGDKAHIKRRMDNNEIRRRAERAIRRLKENSSQATIKEVLGFVGPDPVLFFSIVINGFNNSNYCSLIRHIIDFILTIDWPCNRKEKLVAKLAFDGFFYNSPDFTAFKMINRLKVLNPSPEMLLLYDVNGVLIADYIGLKNEISQRRCLQFLEEYLLMPKVSRQSLLEECPFFARRDMGRYLFHDAKIEFWIRRICGRCNIMPGPTYYRGKRSAFVDSLIESGREGRMSAENAARLVVAHVGDDFHDKRDSIIITARWPKLARLLHKGWNLIGRAPRFVHCDQNLVQDPACRQSLHEKQRDREISYIRSSADFDQMELECASEQTLIVESRPNKNPRCFENDPGFVLFRAPNGRVFGYFPGNLRNEDHRRILEFFSGRTIFTRTTDFIRLYLTQHATDAAWINGAKLAEELTRGRTDDAVASLVWNCRFCGTTREEWFVDPLSEVQENHAAYGINLVSDLFSHVGQDAVLQRVENPL